VTADHETRIVKGDRLELRVWLRLLTCGNLVEGEVKRGLRERFGTTLARFDLMAQLDRAPDGLSMGDLARRLMVSNGNVTALVDRLVGEGLIATEVAPRDRRQVAVRLTQAGKRAFDAMTPIHEGWIADLFGGLDRSELEALHQLLGRLKTSLTTLREAA
jgi:DNA-binding MarR family transcriptional regulator